MAPQSKEQAAIAIMRDFYMFCLLNTIVQGIGVTSAIADSLNYQSSQSCL